ncbi:MAG: hypothetical protein Q4B18_01010 [Bacillota bacterium]|nr:hypothetical protein [Bacillota bacterium]
MKQFKKNKSKLLAMLMTLMMVISMIPVSAFATEASGGTIIPEGAPFTAITTDAGDIVKIEQRENVSFTGFSTYDEVPYYHVTIPEDAANVYVTHPASEDPFADSGYGSAYGYYAETEGWTGSSMNYAFEDADDGYTIIIPTATTVSDWSAGGDVELNFVENEDGNVSHAAAVERNSYDPICFFTFEYAAGGSGGDAEGEEPEHQHKYSDWEVTPATCIAEGSKTKRCLNEGCPEPTVTEIIAIDTVNGHDYGEWEEIKAATCTEDGKQQQTCKLCNDSTKEKSINKLGHKYGAWVETPATCIAEGSKTKTCSNEGCPEKTITEEIPIDTVNGHNYVDNICTHCKDVKLAQDENGVYQIGTAAELLWFAKTVNNGNTGISGALTADIDLSTIEDWPGIGNSSNPFKGAFDGQNKTITLNNSAFGVFAYVKGTESSGNLQKAAEIKNVITAGTVKNTPLIQRGGYVHISNCRNQAEVTGKGSSVSGILGSPLYVNKAGYNYTDIIIENCINKGEIKGSENTGGILGESQAGTVLNGCVNTGKISGTDNVGGLVGYMQESRGTCEIKNSYNTGEVSGNSAVGGIIGNMYNGVTIKNCYNTGKATFAIAGNIYNNTAKIENTYYRGDRCSASIPNKTQSVGLYTENRGTAVTSAEMSGKEIANALGDAFRQSCPSPVFTWQKANVHSEDIVCETCKQGSGRHTEYQVSFEVPAGSEIVGDTTFRAGNDYTFKVNILDGYYAADEFAVYINSTKVEDVNGVYTVEKPNGPFYISVTGVKEYEGILPIVLPGEGGGYRVNPCDGYKTTVESGKDFKFTVDFVEGFKAGDDFIVKSNNEKITPDGDGVYTIENVLVKQTITVEGVEAIPGQKTVDVKFDCTTGENKFYVAEETGTVMMDLEVEVPYFDIGSYGLEKYYYNPNCYVDGNGNINGQQKAGTRETAYNVVTSMHAFIYITEVYYLGYDEKDAGTGLSDITDSDKDGKSDFDEAISWSQGVGSSFMNLWDVGTNLNYHINYAYPLAYPKWGSTSDQQALKDGDRLSTHKIEGSASGSAYGFFVVNDTNDEYDDTDLKDSTKVSQGEQITLTHYRADQGNNYSTAFNKVSDKELYWVEFGDETAGIVVKNEEDESTWSREGFGNLSPEDFKTDGNGKIIIDTTEIEPGTYFIGATGGFASGSGQAGSDGFVSRGAEAGPAYFKLTVEVNKLAEAKAAAKKEIAEYKDAADYREAQQKELAEAIEAANEAIDAAETTEAVEEAVAAAKAELDKIKTDTELDNEEADAEAKTTTHQDKLDSNYLEGKEELKSAGFDSVEKIKTALIEKIEALVEYQASEENTAFLEIMLVYEGTETPVDKEHFPEEGLDIYINYAKIFGDENVDYSKFNYKVVHMFSIDTNGHKAGEIEVLDAEVTENGLKVHVEGLSPFAISYEEKTSTEPDQPNDPTGPEEPNDPVEPEDPTNPEAPVDPTEPKNPVDDEQQTEDNGLAEDNDDSAKTGDDFEPIMLLTIMLIAGAVAVGIRRREY